MSFGMLKHGAIPSKPDVRDLAFKDYRLTGALPTLPTSWGYDNIYPKNGWGMLGNDEWGDCVWAGAAHEHMLENLAAGHPVQFTTNGVLSAYSAVTGFDPNAGPPGQNQTDNGTEIRTALKYRQKTGIPDSTGKRHKIGAYLSLDVSRIQSGDFSEVAEAAFLFGATAFGIEVPQSAEDEFHQDKTWSYVAGSPVLGGHYVPLTAKRRHLEIVTWARVVPVTQAFLEHYLTEAWALVSPDFLDYKGTTPLGFNLQQLNDDLAAL